MKNPLAKAIYIIVVASLFITCSDDNATDENLVIDTTAQTTWEFDTFNYSGATASEEITEDSNLGAFGVITATTGSENNHGAYSGSTITIDYGLEGSGNYAIVSGQDFTDSKFSNNSFKGLTLSCTVGTLITNDADKGATRYESASGGTATVTVDANGKYHITVASGITMNKAIDADGGVVDAPETGTFKLTNAFSFQ